MKEAYFQNLECGLDAIFKLTKDDVMRGVVVNCMDFYFCPTTAPNTPAVIDVKIEQAMDLVKNHLLFTVHEEVEVLKHRISELLARINQLEIENNFLRANASPEVLTALTKRSEEGAIEDGNSGDAKAITEGGELAVTTAAT